MKAKHLLAVLTWILLGCSVLAPPANAFYNPQSGRWLSRDPIEDAAHLAFHRFQAKEEMVHKTVNWNRAFTGLEGWLMNLPEQRLQSIFNRSQREVQDKNQMNLYGFCYNDPFMHVDPQGENPAIVGGALVGCAAGATWSLVTSWLAKDNFCQCSCKAFGSCAVGALGGALAAANPAWGGCIAGAAGGTINNFVGNGCNSLCGQGSGNVKPICAVLGGISSGILGCVVQQLGGSIGGDELAYAMAQVVSNLVGYDVAGYCNLAVGN